MTAPTTNTPKTQNHEQAHAMQLAALHRHTAQRNLTNQKKWEGRTVVYIVVCVTIALTTIAFVARHVLDPLHNRHIKSHKKHYEKLVVEKYGHEMLQKVHAAPIKNPLRLLKCLAESDEHEQSVITFLNYNYELPAEYLAHILKGAHTWVPDEGEAFGLWKNNPKASKRWSSHPSDDEQFSIQGTFLHEFLFSTLTPKEESLHAKKFTWFQLESHSVHSISDKIHHLIAYFESKITQKNVGPYGNSEITDKRPVLLRTRLVGASKK